MKVLLINGSPHEKGCLFRKCRLFKCRAAECYLLRSIYFHVAKVILKSF